MAKPELALWAPTGFLFHLTSNMAFGHASCYGDIDSKQQVVNVPVSCLNQTGWSRCFPTTYVHMVVTGGGNVLNQDL